MAEAKSEKSFLSSIFNAKTLAKVAFWGLSLSFGFAVMGAFDFTFFHNMAEGQAFMDATGHIAEGLLRTDILGLGSVADWMVNSADFMSQTFPNTASVASVGTGIASQIGATPSPDALF